MEVKSRVESIKNKLVTNYYLIEKAAEYKGLKIKTENNSLMLSEPFAIYKLEGEFLEALKKKGFTLDYRNDGVITLCSHDRDGEHSDYWNFRNRPDRKEKDNLSLSLQVSFQISEGKRGIVLKPFAGGTFLSAGCWISHIRVFETIAECDVLVHFVAREIAKEKGRVVASWTELQLGGIRSLKMLFDEFTNLHLSKKINIETLASSHLSPFDPNPFIRYRQEGRDYFLEESYQPFLFRLWQDQLNEFRNNLGFKNVM